MYRDGEREEAGTSQGSTGVSLMPLCVNHTPCRIFVFIFFVFFKKGEFFNPVLEQTDLSSRRQDPMSKPRPLEQSVLLF